MTLSDIIPWNRNDKGLNKRPEADSFLNLRDEIDHLFDNFFEDPWHLRPFETLNNSLSGFMPRLDVNENDKEIRITVELPGMDEKDVQVALGNGVLTINGEKKAENKEKGNGFYRSERSYGSFQRQLSIPVEVNEDNVSALFKNGVLTVSLPKQQVFNSTTKKITIKKG